MIRNYFPELTEKQYQQFQKLAEFYHYWNARINIISRKDIDNVVERHILHSLAIARYIQFINATSILDVGTGGGLPGLPLAIFFPACSFYLVDGTAKKIHVVNEITASLGLTNVRAEHRRAETLNKRYDFVVSRAVMGLKEFYSLTHLRIAAKSKNTKPNGILYLKGGDVFGELDFPHKGHRIVNLNEYFQTGFFDSKVLIHIF